MDVVNERLCESSNHRNPKGEILRKVPADLRVEYVDHKLGGTEEKDLCKECYDAFATGLIEVIAVQTIT